VEINRRHYFWGALIHVFLEVNVKEEIKKEDNEGRNNEM
jgi:hypothetical protein